MRKTRHSLPPLNGCVYPTYPPETSEVAQVVTNANLSKAKWQATHLFEVARTDMQRKFRRYAVRRYRCKPQQVKFDDAGAIRRIRRAELSDADLSLLGQTDGVTIEIMRVPMWHAELVGTLVHEGMHDWCSVRGKRIPAAAEHHCMSCLGDPYE